MNTIPGGYSPIGKDPKQMGFVSSSLPAIDKTQVNVTDPKKGQTETADVVPNAETVVSDSHLQTEGITSEHPGIDPNKTVIFGNKPLASTNACEIPSIKMLSFDTGLGELDFRQGAASAVESLADAAYCLDIGMPNVSRYLADRAFETIEDLQNSLGSLHAHETTQVTQQPASLTGSQDDPLSLHAHETHHLTQQQDQ